MHDDWKSEIGRQSFRDGSPGVTVIVTTQHADVGNAVNDLASKKVGFQKRRREKKSQIPNRTN